MKKIYFAAAAAAMLALLQSACTALRSDDRPEVIATYTATPIQMDGALDETAWHKTPAYPLVACDGQYDKTPKEVQEFYHKGAVEPGKVRVLWDDKFLYVGMEFTDTDIVAEGTEDQKPHHKLGDTAEVFLKPENKSWYWELHVTPRGRKNAFFFPGRGLHGLPSGFPAEPAIKGMKVAVRIKGTLNNSWDKDRKWTAEMAIPLTELNMAGEKLEPGVPWLILFARYNYGRYQPWRENSAFPHLTQLHYHIYEEYARLKLVK